MDPGEQARRLELPEATRLCRAQVEPRGRCSRKSRLLVALKARLGRAAVLAGPAIPSPRDLSVFRSPTEEAPGHPVQPGKPKPWRPTFRQVEVAGEGSTAPARRCLPAATVETRGLHSGHRDQHRPERLTANPDRLAAPLEVSGSAVAAERDHSQAEQGMALAEMVEPVELAVVVEAAVELVKPQAVPEALEGLATWQSLSIEHEGRQG